MIESDVQCVIDQPYNPSGITRPRGNTFVNKTEKVLEAKDNKISHKHQISIEDTSEKILKYV